MNLHSDSSVHTAGRCPRVPLGAGADVAGAGLVALGSLVLFGWLLDIPTLKSVLPQWVTMKVNTALGLLLAGMALWSLRTERANGAARRVGQACAALVGLLGLLTLAEYVFGWNLGIDNAVFAEGMGTVQTSAPGRMAPGTAGSLLCVGLALVLLDRTTRRGRHPAQFLVLPPLAVSLLALLGYLYGAQPLYRLPNCTAMALHTALAFAIASIGILCARPAKGWMALLANTTPGGAMVRRLAPAVLVVIPLLFWLRLLGERAGLYDAGFGIALMVLASMSLLTWVVCRSADSLNRAETERRAQDRRLATLMGNLPGMAYRCRNDAPWTMEFVSDGVRNLTGYEPTDLLGNRKVTYANLIHPDDRATVRRQVEEAIDRREPFRCNYRLRTASGEERWVWEQGCGTFGEDGALLALEGLVTDVSERRRAEDSLRESEARFEATFQQAAVGIAIVAPDGHWLRVNRTLCRIVGYSQEELLAKTFQDITHPDDLNTDLDHMRRMLAREIDTYTMEKRYIRKDGSLVWIDLTVALVWKPDGTPDYFISAVRDIDERKQTESALRESEERFRTLVDTAPEAIFIQTNGCFAYVNAAALRLFGAAQPAELLGQPVTSRIHPDCHASTLERIQSLNVQRQRAGAKDMIFIALDGSARDVITSGVPFSYQNQNGALVFVMDITERKRAESALRESEGNLREANRLAGLGNWKWDMRTGQHVWSRNIYDIYGRDPALPPAVYPEVQQYFTPESWANLSAAVERGTHEGRPYQCDAEVVRSDGTRRWITARGEAVEDSEGNVFLLRGTVQDITERKRTEERLRTLNRQLTTLQLAISRLAAAKTLDEIMAVTRTAARELTSADGATFVLRDGNRCFYADENAIAPLWKGQRFPLETCISGWVMLHHEPVVIEDIYADPRIPADAYRPTFVKSLAMVPIRSTEPLGAIGNYWAAPHRATDEETGLLRALADGVAVAMENVQSYDLQEQRVRERTTELQAANEELDAFAYAVSHDLRAPLRAMSGFSQALIEDFGDTLATEARQFLDEIILASQRMAELIEGLLRLSRVTRGGLRRERVDVTGLATRILTGLAAAEPTRALTWTVDPGLLARGDARMLEAVLANLLGNAWKYTAKTPTPTIRVYAEPTDGNGPVFGVADNGAGFDMRFAAKLFQPFQRLHRQDEFPGIGIGLATVQRILHRHGGSIRASGVPGQGATFCFSLPDGIRDGEEAP